jgi:hypothetical protein
MLSKALIALALVVGAIAASPTPEPTPLLTPSQTLARIRQQFRSHRPPPPYETYTVVRKQLRADGYPDVSNSYTFHVWVRNSDRAAMKRQVFRDDYEYPPVFDRPAFNEARDPGPPTADVFEPKPARPHPVEVPYTPEPEQSQLPVIGRITSLVEYDYRVTSLTIEGPYMHLVVEPIRDPERNRLRDVYADKDTYELHRLVATDKLFVPGDKVYTTIFTITMDTVQGIPVVSDIHGVVEDDYYGDGKDVDYTFRDIRFPATLPDWYFNARQYGAHTNDVPM